MHKISRNKNKKFLISKKKLFNIDFNPQKLFSFNKEQKRSLFSESCEKIKLVSNKKEETSLPAFWRKKRDQQQFFR